MNIDDRIVEALLLCNLPTTITVLKSDGVGEEPKPPYLLITPIDTYNTASARKLPYHKDGHEFEGVFQSKISNYSLTLHATPKDTSHDWFSKLQSGLEADMFDWAFFQNGLGVTGFDKMVYQSFPVNQKNYRRAILDISFTYEVYEEFKVNTIKKLNIEGYLSSNTPNFETSIDLED